MTTMSDLEQLAETMGITIVTHRDGEKGRWNPSCRTISLRHGLHPTQALCTLAHELGHAHHNHRPSASGLLCGRQEREADVWAARVLVDEDDYVAAEVECGGHVGAVAEALGVTVWVVRTWREAFYQMPYYGCV